MDWFLYDNDLRHERVKFEILFAIRTSLCTDDKYSFWSSGMTMVMQKSDYEKQCSYNWNDSKLSKTED